tara:strand:+ start:297 stop:485 length:189 start_codon:yes stop_codon:yes gene_type:complete
LTIDFLYGALVVYLLGILFFFEAFTADEEENTRGYLFTALIWPYIAVKLIVMRILFGKQEED